MELWQLFKRIARGVLYRRKLLLITILIGSLVVLEAATYYFFVSGKPPRYRTSAIILLEARPDRIPLFQEFSPFRPLPVQMAILQSRSLGESVVESLPKSAIEDLLKNPYQVDYWLQLTNSLRRFTGQEPVVHSPQRLALQELQKSRVTFTSKGRDGIVEVRAEASNPRVAVDLVSTYIEVLLARTRTFNVEDTRVSREFLEQQLGEAGKNLKAGESTVAAFTLSRGGVTVPEKYRATVTRLSSLEASLAEVQSSKRLAQIRVAALREKVEAQKLTAPPAPTASPAAQPPPTTTINVQTLQSHLAQLERRLIEFQGRYTEEHPRVVQVKDQIADTRDRLLALMKETTQITPVKTAVAPSERESFKDQLLALEAQLIALNAQEEALQAQIPKLKGALSSLSTDELEYVRLVRENDSKRRLHGLLLEKLTAARTREQGEMKAVKVIDPPDYPLPSMDTRSARLFAMAAVLALGLGFGIPALLEYSLMPVETEEDLASLGLPVLGIVPQLRKSSSLLAPGVTPLLAARRQALPDRSAVTAELEKQQEEAAFFIESFRRIRTAVQVATMGRPLRTLLVTSTHEKEGKSTVLFNMGRSFWEIGKQVVLVDADFYRPTLHRALKISEEEGGGLIDVLRGKAEVQNALVPVAEGLWVSGRSSMVPSQGRGLLANGRVREVIEEMGRDADLVLFDSSPLLIVPDNLFLASHMDAVVLAAKAGKTRLRDLAKTKAMLEQAGGNVIGVVINQAPVTPFRAYYKIYDRHYRSYVKKGPAA